MKGKKALTSHTDDFLTVLLIQPDVAPSPNAVDVQSSTMSVRGQSVQKLPPRRKGPRFQMNDDSTADRYASDEV
ncbi:unnamed protein product [Soboliphyme baturini]|uniref:Uncharacterized protein n=1 Tax=Soboliphyme baturini TaxID=241478 RepID=A0A183J1N5_9BILA|nr:unnamed protein product [Soboliphyme baturini]